MKKLINLLAIDTLTTTTITNVLACCGGHPASNTNTDISDKITNSIDLWQLDQNTKAGFLSKLQSKLTSLNDLWSITINDYDVYKVGTTNPINDRNIIAGNSLDIKIVAKGNKFEGSKDNIKVKYNFQEIPAWTDSNGAVCSLTNVNGTLYVGTSITYDSGKLFKMEL